MAPSGVQKERMREQDLFLLDKEGNVLETPEARPPPYKPPKLSECSPLFMAVSRPFSTLFKTRCNTVPSAAVNNQLVVITLQGRKAYPSA